MKIPFNELKHYFGTGLEVVTTTPRLSNKTLPLEGLVFDGHFILSTIHPSTYERIDVLSDKWKPIVRPMSDLVKEITHNGETFVPIKILEKLSTQNTYLLHLEFRETVGKFTIPIEIINMLYEWHFDVFGWIKKGLAINYNEYHHGNTH